MANATKYNRERSHELRQKTLDVLIEVIDDKDYVKYGKDFRNQILVKLAGGILPKLNEHTGEDGEPLQMIIKRANENKDNNIVPAAGPGDIQSTEV